MSLLEKKGVQTVKFDWLYSASCSLCTLSLLYETKSQQLVNMAVWKLNLLSLLWPWEAQLWPTVLGQQFCWLTSRATNCLFQSIHLSFIQWNSAKFVIHSSNKLLDRSASTLKTCWTKTVLDWGLLKRVGKNGWIQRHCSFFYLFTLGIQVEDVLFHLTVFS